MEIAPPDLHSENRRGNWVRLHTLIVLRWIAIIGQSAAIAVAQRAFGLDLDLGLCFMAVGAAIIANLIAIFLYPASRRLSEREVTAMLLFDLAQLSALLFLTGGLQNPFALLILVPVTISATALRTGPTVIIGATAIATTTFLLWFQVPLQTTQGEILRMPQMFVFGFWASIVIGVVFLGVYARRVTSEINSMSDALLAAQMALVREQKIADLDGVVAAAAHELGTPLATIKLASGELIDELSPGSGFREDAELIHEQAQRCHRILQSMGRASKDDLHLRQTTLRALLSEAAEPHKNRGRELVISAQLENSPANVSPVVWRRPEIVHGLRNLIQNAVDYSRSTVWIETHSSDTKISVRIIDDGEGFPAQIIGRIGDPYVSFRRPVSQPDSRPEYQGMGLGLFIAKTLLERTGATLSFGNAQYSNTPGPTPGQRCGAIVEVIWEQSDLCPDPEMAARGLGENEQFTV